MTAAERRPVAQRTANRVLSAWTTAWLTKADADGFRYFNARFKTGAFPALEELIAEALLAHEAEVREECCKAVCRYCAAGHGINGIGYHDVPGFMRDAIPCAAQAIRSPREPGKKEREG